MATRKYTRDEIVFAEKPDAKYGFKDLSGQKHERLRVLGYAGKITSRNTQWWCECECGGITLVTGANIISKCIKSCGCFYNETRSAVGKKHGFRKTYLFGIWSSIKERCYKSTNKSFHNYGARGIVMQESWISNFGRFCVDIISSIGHRPSENHSLDRYPNQNGNYEIGNLRWATDKEQARNTRTNRLLTYNGETKCIAEWADITGIPSKVIGSRINAYKWCVECALTIPVGKPTGQVKKCTHRIIQPETIAI